ncbi:hypothetical protein COV18_05885 [Candidatus Woesearchaeota archaeon CG10_big_fil_rev_8_21_14_0_10_37_12]|nr:MAG: hypothetical protein COV18_05885 [Candidatus Woesearchaeota archaeon CG10_big_fil_rev_8_21_14_0_10_37_12]
MKFLIIGDLHGAKPKIFVKDFDVIIAPGDFCSDGLRKYMFQALIKRMKTDEDIDWYDFISRQKAKQAIQKSLRDGRKILNFLNSFNKPVYVLPGNWDWTPHETKWKYLQQNHWKKIVGDLKNIKDCHFKNVQFKKLQFVGHGISSGPEKLIVSKRLESEQASLFKAYNKYFKKISTLFMRAKKNKKPVIFLSHNVPYYTKLDKVINKKSPRNGEHCGSILARELILKHKPLVCIGGHMHEHFGKDKIGKTIVINAGFGKNVNTLLEIKNGKITKLQFYLNKKKTKEKHGRYW